MSRTLLPSFVLVATVLSIANVRVASADPVRLDQSAWTFVSCTGCGDAVVAEQSVAQTFTAGLDGRLTNVNLGIYRSTAATATDVVVNLLPVQHGGLTTFDLSGARAAFSVPISSVPICPNLCASLPSVSVSLPSPLAVAANDSLAIVLSRSGGSSFPDWVIWTYASEPGEGIDYSGGQGYYQSPSGANWVPEAQDHRFQTFVDTTPEPAPIVFVAVGLIVAGRATRRKHHLRAAAPFPARRK
jgi:hypothetical protein